MSLPTDEASAEGAMSSIQRFRSETQPIFVLGSVRSGTSALGMALRDGAGIPGAHEGHVSTLLQMLTQTLDRVIENFPSQSHFLINSLDGEDLKNHLKQYFLEFFAKNCPAGMWADKSPDDFEGAPAIRSAPALLEMFPQARFIYCKRRGIENVMSRLAKFPQVPFWYHCASWAGTIVAWHEVRDALGDRWMEVAQEDMALRPADVARELGAFLVLDEAQVMAVEASLSGRRAEQTRPAQELNQLDLSETGWSEDNQHHFIQTCGPAMDLAGYRIAGKGQGDGERSIRLFWISTPSVSATAHVNVPEERHCYLSDAEFTIAPPQTGERGEATYFGIELRAGAAFRAGLSLRSAGDQSVQFGVEVRDMQGNIVVEASHRLASGENHALTLSLQDVEPSTFTVTLWTQVEAGVVVGPVDAVWNTPTFFLPSA